MNLIITSQDAGGSLHLVPLLKFLKESYREISILIIAKDPAFKILQKNKVNAVKINGYQNILKTINDFKPNFILVSLSSFRDLDCIALEIAKEKNIPSGCIQDFWGSIGFFQKNNLPNYFFVENILAKNLTLQNVDEKCQVIEVGLTKPLNQNVPKKLESSKKIIAVIGQPSIIPGVEATMIEIFKALDDQLSKDFEIFYKPHPSSLPLSQNTEKILSDYRIVVFDGQLNDLFISAALIINIFSTVLIDFLQFRQFTRCNGNIISCIWNNKLKEYVAESDIQVAKFADKFFEDKKSFQKFLSNYRNPFKLSYNHRLLLEGMTKKNSYHSITKIILENKK